jgi:predicted metalloprotease with PDZ domain
MSRVILFNTHNYWHFASQDHPYMFAFADYKIDEGGFVWFKRKADQRGYINLSFPWSVAPMEIRWVASGGSAERAGIRVGDVITHVNGKDVRQIGFAAAVNEAAGPIGEPLDITIYRESEKRSFTVTITREEERF